MRKIINFWCIYMLMHVTILMYVRRKLLLLTYVIRTWRYKFEFSQGGIRIFLFPIIPVSQYLTNFSYMYFSCYLRYGWKCRRKHGSGDRHQDPRPGGGVNSAQVCLDQPHCSRSGQERAATDDRSQGDLSSEHWFSVGIVWEFSWCVGALSEGDVILMFQFTKKKKKFKTFHKTKITICF